MSTVDGFAPTWLRLGRLHEDNGISFEPPALSMECSHRDRAFAGRHLASCPAGAGSPQFLPPLLILVNLLPVAGVIALAKESPHLAATLITVPLGTAFVTGAYAHLLSAGSDNVLHMPPGELTLWFQISAGAAGGAGSGRDSVRAANVRAENTQTSSYRFVSFPAAKTASWFHLLKIGRPEAALTEFSKFSLHHNLHASTCSWSRSLSLVLPGRCRGDYRHCWTLIPAATI
jgi:hypothetical protein